LGFISDFELRFVLAGSPAKRLRFLSTAEYSEYAEVLQFVFLFRVFSGSFSLVLAVPGSDFGFLVMITLNDFKPQIVGMVIQHFRALRQNILPYV
jgi:hypothetical protein